MLAHISPNSCDLADLNSLTTGVENETITAGTHRESRTRSVDCATSPLSCRNFLDISPSSSALLLHEVSRVCVSIKFGRSSQVAPSGPPTPLALGTVSCDTRLRHSSIRRSDSIYPYGLHQAPCSPDNRGCEHHRVPWIVTHDHLRTLTYPSTDLHISLERPLNRPSDLHRKLGW